MPDDDDEPVRPNVYKSKISGMRNALFIIGFIGYVLLAKVWATYGMYNTWYYVGGWGLAFLIGMFLLTPLIIANRSPKFSSTKIGGTIALPQPILTVPAQGGWPEMVMYDPGSVRGYGIENHRESAKGYVWLPWLLAIILGEGGRGVNVNANAKLVQLGEHCELAPHLYDAMIKYPKYKAELPIWMGLFPELINNPTPEQLEYFKKRCEDYGIPRKVFEGTDGVVPFRVVLEEYASTLSKFRYPDLTLKSEQLWENVIRNQSAMVDRLKRDNAFFKSEITALQDLYKVRKELPPEPTWRDRLPFSQDSRQPEREESDRERRY